MTGGYTMERRNFLLGLFALTAGSAAVAIAGKAEAAPVASAATLPAAAPDIARGTALPDGTPIEKAQYYRGRPYRGRRRPRRQRQVCRVARNRFGRPVRVCRTVWY